MFNLLAIISPKKKLLKLINQHFFKYETIFFVDINSFVKLQLLSSLKFSGAIIDMNNNVFDDHLYKFNIYCPDLPLLIIGRDLKNINIGSSNVIVSKDLNHKVLENFSILLIDFEKKFSDNHHNIIWLSSNLGIDLINSYLIVNKRRVNISLKERDLLLYLLNHRDAYSPSEEILVNVWDEFYSIEIVRQYIYRIRNKLNPYSYVIQYKKGLGYKIINEIR